MKNVFGNIVLAVLALGLSAGVWWQAKANDALRRQQGRLRTQAVELANLRNQTAPTPDVSSTELSGLERDRADVVRLRTEIEALRARLADREKNALAAATVKANPVEKLWRNVGRANPDDALHAVVSAAVNGETDALTSMIAFEPETRAAAEKLFASLPEETRAEYGSPEKLIAFMMSGRMAPRLTVPTLVEQTAESVDVMKARFQFKRGKGKTRDVTFRFQRDGADWRLLVPKSVIADYQKVVSSR